MDPTRLRTLKMDLEHLCGLIPSVTPCFPGPRLHAHGTQSYSDPNQPAEYDLNDQRAFEQQLDENPMDSTLHGGYADWLDEHGASRHAQQQRRLHSLIPEYQPPGTAWFDPQLESENADRATQQAYRLNTPEAHNEAAVANYRAYLAHHRNYDDVQARHHAEATAVHDQLTEQLREQHPEQNARYDDADGSFYSEQPTEYGDAEDEAAFHAALDDNPEDHITRQVFADWLEERGDPRAAGYRALGMLGKTPDSSPMLSEGGSRWGYHNGGGIVSGTPPDAAAVQASLPGSWVDAMATTHGSVWSWPLAESRREMEDRAAHAFSQLHPDEQKRILQSAQSQQGNDMPTQNSHYSEYADPAGSPQSQTQIPGYLRPAVNPSRVMGAPGTRTAATGRPPFRTGPASARLTGSPRLGHLTRSFQNLLAQLRQRGLYSQYASADYPHGAPQQNQPQQEPEEEPVTLTHHEDLGPDVLNWIGQLSSDSEYLSRLYHGDHLDPQELERAQTEARSQQETAQHGIEWHEDMGHEVPEELQEHHAVTSALYDALSRRLAEVGGGWGNYAAYSDAAFFEFSQPAQRLGSCDDMPSYPQAQNVGGLTHPAWASMPLPEHALGYEDDSLNYATPHDTKRWLSTLTPSQSRWWGNFFRARGPGRADSESRRIMSDMLQTLSPEQQRGLHELGRPTRKLQWQPGMEPPTEVNPPMPRGFKPQGGVLGALKSRPSLARPQASPAQTNRSTPPPLPERSFQPLNKPAFSRSAPGNNPYRPTKPRNASQVRQPVEASAYSEFSLPSLPHTANNVGGITHPAWASMPLPQHALGYGDPSPQKAREILHDGTVHGHPLTDKQRRFMGWKSHQTNHAAYSMPTFKSGFANLKNPHNPWVTPNEGFWHGHAGNQNYAAVTAPISDDLRNMLEAHRANPTDLLIHGAILDKIQDDYGVSRTQAREMKKQWMRDAYGTPSANQANRRLGDQNYADPHSDADPRQGNPQAPLPYAPKRKGRKRPAVSGGLVRVREYPRMKHPDPNQQNPQYAAYSDMPEPTSEYCGMEDGYSPVSTDLFTEFTNLAAQLAQLAPQSTSSYCSYNSAEPDPNANLSDPGAFNGNSRHSRNLSGNSLTHSGYASYDRGYL